MVAYGSACPCWAIGMMGAGASMNYVSLTRSKEKNTNGAGVGEWIEDGVTDLVVDAVALLLADSVRDDESRDGVVERLVMGLELRLMMHLVTEELVILVGGSTLARDDWMIAEQMKWIGRRERGEKAESGKETSGKRPGDSLIVFLIG